MLNETSAGAVIFRRDNEIKYLILHYKFKGDYWDFPRGNIEKGETEEQTAVREIKEETGISDVRFLPEFKKKVHWYYKRNGETVFKEVTFFLAETMEEKITLSKEHIGYAWLSYEKVMKRLTFGNAKEVLEKADDVLKK